MSKHTSFFAQILEGIIHRASALHEARWINSSKNESEDFIYGLNRALDMDIEQGTLDINANIGPNNLSMFEVVIDRITSPVVQPFDSSLASPTWPARGSVWVDPEYYDPRERLLARLVHLGVNPWKKMKVGANEATIAHMLLMAGYGSVFNQAVALHPFPNTVHREPVFGSGAFSLLELAVSRNLIPQASLLLELGAQDSVLHAAKTPEMVKLLLRSGVSTVVSGASAAFTRWSKDLPSQVVREMMEVSKGATSPEAALRSALAGRKWRPIADAMAAYPQYRDLEDVASVPGVREVPLGVGLLLRSNLMSTNDASYPDTVRNALKFFLASELDVHKKVVPEKMTCGSLARLTLLAVKNQVKPRATSPARQAMQGLEERIRITLETMLPEGVETSKSMEVDMQAFLSAHTDMRGFPGVSNIALLGIKSVLANQHISKPASSWSKDDFLSLGSYAGLVMSDSSRIEVRGDVWCKIFGNDLSSVAPSTWRSHPPLIQAVESLINKSSAEDHPALMASALSIFTLPVCQVIAVERKNLIPMALGLRKLLDQGIEPDCSLEYAQRFLSACSKNAGFLSEMKEVCDILATPLVYRAEDRQLESSTAPAPKPPGGALRL